MHATDFQPTLEHQSTWSTPPSRPAPPRLPLSPSIPFICDRQPARTRRTFAAARDASVPSTCPFAGPRRRAESRTRSQSDLALRSLAVAASPMSCASGPLVSVAETSCAGHTAASKPHTEPTCAAGEPTVLNEGTIAAGTGSDACERGGHARLDCCPGLPPPEPNGSNKGSLS